jgi:thiol-disulfide isomerase/thioredoxin
MRAKHIIMLVIFVAGFWGGNVLFKYYSNEPEAKSAAQSMLRHRLSDFTLNDLNGTRHNVHEWDDHVLVLNFWATWCPPCRKETPMFVELQEQYGAQGLQFIGIAIDNKEKVVDFMDTYGVNYPILIGSDDAIQVAKDYGNRFGALPYTVIIDRSGVISYVQRGELTREVAEKTIKPLL